jgi:hypothetical protein
MLKSKGTLKASPVAKNLVQAVRRGPDMQEHETIPSTKTLAQEQMLTEAEKALQYVHSDTEKACPALPPTEVWSNKRRTKIVKLHFQDVDTCQAFVKRLYRNSTVDPCLSFDIGDPTVEQMLKEYLEEEDKEEK